MWATNVVYDGEKASLHNLRVNKELINIYFNRRHPVVFLILKIKWFYSVQTQQ